LRTLKPEESQGYSSNQQLKLAEANVQAAMHGQPVRPPQEGDDHNAQMYVYQSIVQLLQEAGQQQTHAYQQLSQLIQATAAMMQQEQEKQATPGQRMATKKPFLETT
jgi:ribosome-binding protein aMBF1 (putative translation factor)